MWSEKMWQDGSGWLWTHTLRFVIVVAFILYATIVCCCFLCRGLFFFLFHWLVYIERMVIKLFRLLICYGRYTSASDYGWSLNFKFCSVILRLSRPSMHIYCNQSFFVFLFPSHSFIVCVCVCVTSQWCCYFFRRLTKPVNSLCPRDSRATFIQPF